MTENEAIRRCDLLINGYSVSCSTNDAFKDENKGHMTFETMREFAETCKQALEEIQQCRAIGTVEDVAFYKKCYDEESYEYCGEYGTDNCGCKDRMEYLEKKVAELEAIGTIEEFKALKEKLQGYKNQMSIYAEQHKVILASDVLDMLEELDWSE